MFDKISTDSLIEQTKKIQMQAQVLRDTANNLEVYGVDSTREMVKVIMNAKRVIKKVSINPAVMKNKEILEKSIIDAINNAASKVEKCMENSMISLASSIRESFAEIKPPL